MSTATEDLGMIGTFWSVPAIPEIPEKFHGEPTFIFLGCYTGPFEKGEEAIRPFREFDVPIADLSSSMKFLDVQKMLDEDYPDGALYYWKSKHIFELSDELISALVECAPERPSETTSIDIWTLGGAFGRVDPQETPFFHRKAPFLLNIESNWDELSESDKNVEWTREIFEKVSDFSLGGTYLNFPGFAEEGTNLVKGAYGSNYERLKEIKSKYDPDNLFHGNLNIK
jgi:hypothetical protein